MNTVAARDNGSGGAVVTVAGASSLADHRFRIVRADDACLQANGKWASNKADLSAPASLSGDDLVLELSPTLCENTEETTYYFELTGRPGAPMSVSWPAIIQPIVQRASSIRAPKPPPPPLSPAPGPEPVEATRPPVVPASSPVDPVPPGPEPGARSGNGLKLGIGGAVLVAAVAVTLLVLKPWAPSSSVSTADTTTTPAPVPTPVPTPVQVPPPDPATDADALTVPELARGEPSVMLAQAQKRMPTKPQDALLLLEVAGSDRQFGPALTALGKVYDPLLPRQGGIPADPRQAAKAYRDAAGHGDDGAAPEREALRQKLVQQRDAGDTTAKLILGDFWP